MQQHNRLDIPLTLEQACDPRRMALLVYDAQVGIFHQLKDSASLIEQMKAVLTAARQAGVRVFFVRHMTLPTNLMGVFQLRMWRHWQRAEHVKDVTSWFLRDSEGFPILPELAPQPDEAIFDKITMSAFEGTPLSIVLRDCGINALAIIGAATEIGIEPTVRHAADLGIIPIVVEDACGAGHQEAGERAIASMKFMGDAFFTDVATICQLLKA